MTKIEAFQTTDGKVFTIEKVAEIHQVEVIDKREKIGKFLENLNISRGVDTQDIVDIIFTHQDELFTILSARVM